MRIVQPFLTGDWEHKMITRLVAKSALAVCALALVGTATVAMPTPADARVFVGFGFGPFWGYPYYPYPYPYAYPYPYPAPPVVYSPGYAPADPGYAPAPAAAAAPATWYYCNNPPGYYPYVQQCSTGWRAVPAQPSQQ